MFDESNTIFEYSFIARTEKYAQELYSFVPAARYCPMLEKEGGITLVQELLNDPRPNDKIRRLANTIMEQWESWTRTAS